MTYSCRLGKEIAKGIGTDIGNSTLSSKVVLSRWTTLKEISSVEPIFDGSIDTFTGNAGAEPKLLQVLLRYFSIVEPTPCVIVNEVGSYEKRFEWESYYFQVADPECVVGEAYFCPFGSCFLS